MDDMIDIGPEQQPISSGARRGSNQRNERVRQRAGEGSGVLHYCRQILFKEKKMM